MPEELQVVIGADPSNLIRETRRAGQAFSKFTDGLEADSKKATEALDSFDQSTEKLSESVDELARVGRRVGSGNTSQQFAKIGDAAEDAAKGTGKARDALGRFEKQASSAEREASDLSQALKDIGGGDVRRRIRGVGNLANNLGRRLGSVANQAAEVGSSFLLSGATVAVKALTASVVALGVALVGIGARAVTEFAAFEQGFAQVLTLIDDGEADISALDSGIRELSQRFGIDLKDATESAYQAISAGVEPARTVEFLGVAFQGAAAGAATVTEATDLATSALNAFNLPISEANQVLDVFFATVDKGKTDIGQLAASIGQVAPIAASSGVELEELSAAIAALTAGGLSTAEAVTQIRAAITGIAAPSAGAAAALEEIGVSAQSLRQEGLAATFERIRSATNNARDGLARFLPNVRAQAAAATLAGTGYDRFIDSLEATTNAAGATDRAFARVANTLQTQFNRLSATLSNTFVTLGRTLAPIVQQTVGVLSEVATGVQADFELLGQAFESRFGPQIEDFFENLGKASGENSSLVSDGLEAIATGITSVAGFIRGSSEIFATFAAVLRGVGEGAVLVGSSLRVALGVTIAALVTPTTLLITALRTLAEAVGADGLAGTLRVGEDALKEFRGSLIDSATDSAQTASDAFRGLTEGVGDTFDATKRASEDFADGLTSVGVGTRALRGDLEGLRASQDSVTPSTNAAASAQGRLAASTTAAAASARAAVGEQRALSSQVRETAAGVQILSGAAAEAAAAQDRAAASADRLASSGRGVEELTRRFGEGAVSAESLAVSLGIATAGLTNFSAAFDVRRLTPALDEASAVATELQGSLREAGVSAATALAEGRLRANEFKTTVEELREIGSSFLDTSVIDQFAEAGGFATLDVNRLRQALDEVRVVSNVLTGDFREAGVAAVRAFATGELNASRFKQEIEDLSAAQLGLREVFRSAEDLAQGFEDLRSSAARARGELGQGIRSEVERLGPAFEAGKISLDELIAGVREAGEAADRFRSLSDLQVAAVQRLKVENEGLANTVVDLAQNLDGSLQPALRNFLEANRQGVLDASALETALEGLAEENERLAESAEDATRGLEDQADAARDLGRESARAARGTSTLNQSITRSTSSLADFLQQATQGTPLEDTLAQLELSFNTGRIGAQQFENGLEQLFGAIQVGNQGFVDAAAASRLYEESQDRLLPKINELGRRLDDTGRNQLRSIINNFAIGASSADEFRASLQRLADAATQAGRATENGLSQISAFGRPGRLQVSNQASGGSQLLGLQGRATGSANFANNLEADLGAATGLAPKALRSAIGRAGGLAAFVRERGVGGAFVGRFAAAGAVNQTGFGQLEAGEFVLGQRGQTELGRLVAGALNGNGEGSAPPQVNQTNNFNVQADGAFGANSIEELAFMLAPALANARNLGASQSPLQ